MQDRDGRAIIGVGEGESPVSPVDRRGSTDLGAVYSETGTHGSAEGGSAVRHPPYSTTEVEDELGAWIDARAWTTGDGPLALFGSAVAWLVERKVLLPWVSVLARLVARVRDQADQRLWDTIDGLLTDARRQVGVPLSMDPLVAGPQAALKAEDGTGIGGRYIQGEETPPVQMSSCSLCGPVLWELCGPIAIVSPRRRLEPSPTFREVNVAR